jgi:hypothetical protein
MDRCGTVVMGHRCKKIEDHEGACQFQNFTPPSERKKDMGIHVNDVDHKTVLMKLRRNLANVVDKSLEDSDPRSPLGKVNDNYMMALALVTIALDLDYISDNLNSVGEGA